MVLQNIILDFINNNPVLSVGFALVILSMITGLSYRNLKIRTNQRMSAYVFLAGIAFIFFGVYGTNFWTTSAGTNMASMSEKPISDKKKETEETVKKIIAFYFKALETREFENVRDFYRSRMELCYTKENVAHSKTQKILKDRWQNILSDSYEIDWKSWNYQTDEQGNHLIQLQVAHRVKPKSAQEYQEKTESEIRLNSDFKMYYVK